MATFSDVLLFGHGLNADSEVFNTKSLRWASKYIHISFKIQFTITPLRCPRARPLSRVTVIAVAAQQFRLGSFHLMETYSWAYLCG